MLFFTNSGFFSNNKTGVILHIGITQSYAEFYINIKLSSHC